MEINKAKVMEIMSGIKEGTYSKLDLKLELGGDRLNEIFDQRTQDALLDNIISNGKIHNLVQDENGLDILESLLNNQVKGNLSDFYMIKPDYILQLPPEQQKKMADSISGGRQDLSVALQNLWSKGIRTEACTTKSSDNIPMLQLNIKENEIVNQDIVQQLYQQRDISGRAFYDYQARDFHINLEGNNLYNYLQGQDIPISQTDKNNLFEDAVKDSLQFAEEMYSSYSKNGMDTSELKQEIISERRSLQEINSRNRTKQNQSQALNKSSKEKKSWELEPDEKARIQRESVEIAKKYREQQKQQPQKNQEQGDTQIIQGQVPQQPAMDMGDMEL